MPYGLSKYIAFRTPQKECIGDRFENAKLNSSKDKLIYYSKLSLSMANKENQTQIASWMLILYTTGVQFYSYLPSKHYLLVSIVYLLMGVVLPTCYHHYI